MAASSTSLSPWRDAFSGACFGAALTAAGMYSPSTIIGQMQLTNFHMMKGFLAASATSALAIVLGHSLRLSLRLSSCKTRAPAPLSFALPLLHSAYDGNLFGGLILGCGMALTGACPGTVLPQVATGISTGGPVFLGAILGGIIYSLCRPLLQGAPDEVRRKEEEALSQPEVYEQAGISRNTAVILYQALCGGVVIATVYFFPRNSPSLLSPVVGGLVIGATQFINLSLTGATIGMSAAYEQIGDFFWWLVKPAAHGNNSAKTPRPNVQDTASTLGTLAGSWVLSQLVDIPRPQGTVDISVLRAVLGGILLVFGARIAGGCTSGHGISGMSMFSIASIVSVAAMFAGGMGLGVFA